MESTSLKLSESFDVPADPARVWSLLSDPTAVVGCMPGAAITGTADDGSLLGTMVAAFGPTRVTFQGKVLPEFDDTSQTGRLRARGQDARGRTKAAATASFHLTDAADSRTRVAFDSAFDISGGLAVFMRAGGQELLRRMLQDFTANLAVLAVAEQPVGADQGPEDQGEARTPTARVEPVGVFSLVVRALLHIGRRAVHRLRRRAPDKGGLR